MSDNRHGGEPPAPDLAAIQQRLGKITPGPWAWESIAEKSNEFAVGTAFNADGKQLLGRLPEGEWVEDAVIRRACVGMNESGHAHFADADFIAHAPTDVAALLDLASSLSAQLAEARADTGARQTSPDVVCEHGTAMDVHCCNCHSGFILDRHHECPKVS